MPAIRPVLPSLLVFACLAWVGCGDGGGGPPPPLGPKVQVTTPQSNVVGSQIEVDVQVSGCEQVSQSALYDGTRLVRAFAMTSNPMALVLTTSDISFASDGVAAQLSLTAKIVCSDGRIATSQAAGALFLPVAEVISLPNNVPVVPNFYFVDGSGDSATFVGCVTQTNGQNLLQRINQQGTAINTIDRTDVMCDDTAVFTDPGGGVRWMLVPGVGAMAFDPSLHVTSVARGNWSDPSTHNIQGDSIVINSDDGNAIIWQLPNDEQPVGNNLFRVRPHCLPTNCPDDGSGAQTGSPTVWGSEIEGAPPEDESDPFQLLGDPMVVADSLIVLPGYHNDITTNTIFHQVHIASYTDGTESSGAIVSLEGSDIAYQLGGTAKTELMTLNPDQAVVYLPFVTQTTPSMISEIRAYDDTTTGSPLWVSPSFDSEVGQVVVFGGGTRLAAIAPNQVWLLNAADGTILNPGHPINAAGSYFVEYVEVGPNEELYILNGPPPPDMNTPPLPGEIVTVQKAVDGELMRYQAQAGSLFARVDDGGGVWMRFNTSMAKLLSSDDYVALKNQ